MKLSVSILNIDYKNIEKNLNDIIDDIDSFIHELRKNFVNRINNFSS